MCGTLTHTHEQPGSGPVALPALGSLMQGEVTLGLVGWNYCDL